MRTGAVPSPQKPVLLPADQRSVFHVARLYAALWSHDGTTEYRKHRLPSLGAERGCEQTAQRIELQGLRQMDVNSGILAGGAVARAGATGSRHNQRSPRQIEAANLAGR